MATQLLFNTFNKRIRIENYNSQDMFSHELESRITNAIRDAFDKAELTFLNAIVSGSMASDTAIKRKGDAADIDRILVIEKTTAPEHPVIVKFIIKKTLLQQGLTNIKLNEMSVTGIHAASKTHLEYILYAKEDKDYYLGHGTLSDSDGSKWIKTDLISLDYWLISESAFTAFPSEKVEQLKRVIRYMKKWKEHRFDSEPLIKNTSSFGLTIMTKSAFHAQISNDGEADDLSSLKHTVSNMLHQNFFTYAGQGRYSIQVKLPKSPWSNIFKEHSLYIGTTYREGLNDLLFSLDKAATSQDSNLTLKALHVSFGNSFPSEPGLIHTEQENVYY